MPRYRCPPIAGRRVALGAVAPPDPRRLAFVLIVVAVARRRAFVSRIEYELTGGRLKVQPARRKPLINTAIPTVLVDRSTYEESVVAERGRRLPWGSPLSPACSSGTPPASTSTAVAPPSPVSEADKEWPTQNKDAASTRYSTLNQVTADNVKTLKVAWSFSTGVLRGHEGEPIVVGNTMYVHTPFPNIVYALDLSKEGAPIKWKYAAEAGSGGHPDRVLRHGRAAAWSTRTARSS